MTLDIVEGGEEYVESARRTIRRVSVVIDCSLVCNRMALLSRAFVSGLVYRQTMAAHGRVARM